VECNVTNVGKKTLPQIQVTLMYVGGAEGALCSDILSAAESRTGHTCFDSYPGTALCRVTITGGNHRSVRAVLNVVDSNGATILSVPATK
jgi:hypothetical protein